jgi:hypothetical protein
MVKTTIAAVIVLFLCTSTAFAEPKEITCVKGPCDKFKVTYDLEESSDYDMVTFHVMNPSGESAPNSVLVINVFDHFDNYADTITLRGTAGLQSKYRIPKMAKMTAELYYDNRH